MRNILVFPDHTSQSFQYPDNRDIEIGEKIKVQFKDDNIHVLAVTSIDIDQVNKVTYYYLS